MSAYSSADNGSATGFMLSSFLASWFAMGELGWPARPPLAGVPFDPSCDLPGRVCDKFFSEIVPRYEEQVVPVCGTGCSGLFLSFPSWERWKPCFAAVLIVPSLHEEAI